MLLTRRDAIIKALFGPGLIGLRSLATGIPAAILLNPRAALAASTVTNPLAQYLVLTGSQKGDPINGNVPGTYLDPNCKHPPDPSMAPTMATWGNQTHKAAKPWGALPDDVRNRTCFFHHATNTTLHPDQGLVYRLGGSVANREMLVSFFAKQLAPALGTTQAQPMALGAIDPTEAIYFSNSPQPRLTPTMLAAVLGTQDTVLSSLDKTRDADLDSLNAFFKAHGNAAQAKFIDQYANTRGQMRNIVQSLLSKLGAITDDGPSGQVDAAVLMFQMNITPVVTLHLPFGNDNHMDNNLVQEAAEHQEGIGAIARLQANLKDAGLQDKVTFASLNVFGRTMSLAKKGLTGRDHNGNHSVGVMIGSAIRGGVVGGVVNGNEYEALPIASSSGLGDPAGDIVKTDTMDAYGLTLGVALGIDEATLKANITTSTGRVVPAALAR